MINEKEESSLPSLYSQSFWLLFSKIVGFCFAFALPLVVVRSLNTADFGVYRQIFTVVSTAVAVLPLGFGVSAFYYLARGPENRRPAVLNILAFYFVVGGVAFLVFSLFPSLLGGLFASPEIAKLSPLIGLVIWVWLFSMFLETVAVANRETWLSTIFIISAQLTKAIFIIAAVAMFPSVEVILYAAISQGLLQAFVLAFYVAKRFPGLLTSFDAAFFKEHFTYAVPLGLAGLFWVAQTDLHFYFVGANFSSAEFAVYAVGCFQLPLVSLLSESVASVLIPRMSELQMKGANAEMLSIAIAAAEKLALFYFPAYVFLMITAESVITSLFTREYRDSVPIFMVFLSYLPFAAMMSDPIVRSFPDLGRRLLKIRIITTLVMIPCLFIAVRYFGLTGVIVTMVAIQIAERVVISSMSFYRLGLRVRNLGMGRNIGKIALISFISGLPAWLAYAGIRPIAAELADMFVNFAFGSANYKILDLFEGGIAVGATFAVYGAVFLTLCVWSGLVDKGDRERVFSLFRGASA